MNHAALHGPFLSLDEVALRIQNHLLTQGKRSQNSDGDLCMYRGHDGTACAVGGIIPDDHYDPVIEGLTPTSSVPHESPHALHAFHKALYHAGVDPLDEDTLWLLTYCQRIHDNVRTQDWVEETDALRRNVARGEL